MEYLHVVLEFLKLLVLTTVNQLVSLLGIFFVAGLLLYLLARFTRNTFAKTAGRQLDIILTGWLGTPVHEISHAFFCILFGHRIVEMRLYQPNSTDGSLGYVNHAYNPNNAYHKIGNLFIGAGPVIFGAIVLYAVMYYLLPNHQAVVNQINASGMQIDNIMDITTQWKAIFASAENLMKSIFTPDNFSDYRFWIFIYISICIASHMELSPADISGMMKGLVSLVILLVVINFVALLIGRDISRYIFNVGSYIGMFFGVYVYAILISLLNFLVSFVLLSIYSLIKYRRLFNPIR